MKCSLYGLYTLLFIRFDSLQHKNVCKCTKKSNRLVGTQNRPIDFLHERSDLVCTEKFVSVPSRRVNRLYQLIDSSASHFNILSTVCFIKNIPRSIIQMYWISVRFYGMDDIPSIYLKSKNKCSNKTIICPNHELCHEPCPTISMNVCHVIEFQYWRNDVRQIKLWRHEAKYVNVSTDRF